MNKINGKSLSSQKSLLTSEQVGHIYDLVGSLNKEINQITNDSFGYPGQKALQGKNRLIRRGEKFGITYQPQNRLQLDMFYDTYFRCEKNILLPVDILSSCRVLPAIENSCVRFRKP